MKENFKNLEEFKDFKLSKQPESEAYTFKGSGFEWGFTCRMEIQQRSGIETMNKTITLDCGCQVYITKVQPPGASYPHETGKIEHRCDAHQDTHYSGSYLESVKLISDAWKKADKRSGS